MQNLLIKICLVIISVLVSSSLLLRPCLADPGSVASAGPVFWPILIVPPSTAVDPGRAYFYIDPIKPILSYEFGDLYGDVYFNIKQVDNLNPKKIDHFVSFDIGIELHPEDVTYCGSLYKSMRPGYPCWVSDPDNPDYYPQQVSHKQIYRIAYDSNPCQNIDLSVCAGFSGSCANFVHYEDPLHPGLKSYCDPSYTSNYGATDSNGNYIVVWVVGAAGIYYWETFSLGPPLKYPPPDPSPPTDSTIKQEFLNWLIQHPEDFPLPEPSFAVAEFNWQLNLNLSSFRHVSDLFVSLINTYIQKFIDLKIFTFAITVAGDSLLVFNVFGKDVVYDLMSYQSFFIYFRHIVLFICAYCSYLIIMFPPKKKGL